MVKHLMPIQGKIEVALLLLLLFLAPFPMGVWYSKIRKEGVPQLRGKKAL